MKGTQRVICFHTDGGVYMELLLEKVVKVGTILKERCMDRQGLDGCGPGTGKGDQLH